MIRNIIIALLWTALSLSFTQADTIIPGGYVSGTWTEAGSPYLIQGDITVYTDSTLNIEPGVDVLFQGSYNLTVNGYLEAVGTENDSINFTGTLWNGIEFINAPDSSHLTFCTVSGCQALVAAVYCSNSNPVITHCTVGNNWGQFNGGVYLGNSNPRISFCKIEENECPIRGCGISIENSSPEISYCDITGNEGINGIGGGIYCAGDGTALILNCNITRNRALSGGGIYVEGGGSLVISNSTISYNIAFQGGGFAFINGSNATITDCIFNADSTTNTNYAKGGGILISSSNGDITIVNSTVTNCWSASSSASSGAGIHIDHADRLSISGSTFDGIHCGADGAGAIYSANCANLIIDHCDFVKNTVALGAAGITLNGSTNMTLTNSIFRSMGDFNLTFWSYTSASISYCDFYGATTTPFISPPPGLGTLVQTNANGDSCDVFCNIYLDPLFVDFPGGDYHLTEASPCIDAGDPASPLDPDNTITDMGRYFFDQRVPDIELSTTSLDFGSVTLGDWGDMPLTIYNVGDANLILYDVFAVMDVFTTDWNPADSLVSPGDSLEITVTFTPADTVAYDDVLTVDNNDELQEVQLSGQGDLPPGIGENSPAIPTQFALRGPYPNPFNPVTTFRIELPVTSRVNLEILDVSGRFLGLIVAGWRSAGYHDVSFDASGLVSGVYIYSMTAGEFSASGKMVLLK